MHEHRPLVEPHVVADEGGAHLVLLDGAQHAAEGRMHQPPQQHQHQRQQHQHEVEEGLVARQVDVPAEQRQRQPLDVEQPVLAAGDAVPLDGDEPEHLAEGDGQQRVVDAAPVRDEQRHHRAQQPGRHQRAEQAAQQPGIGALLQQPHRVGAQAEVGAVAEAGQARLAEQQVVRHREHHPDDDFQRQVLVQAHGAQPQRRARQHGQRDDHRHREQRGGLQQRAGHRRRTRKRHWTDENVCSILGTRKNKRS